MNKLNLKILIPTYKRAKIFRHTLDSLFETIDESVFNVEICVGVLANDAETYWNCYLRDMNNPNINAFVYHVYQDNIGKARCLNDLFQTFCAPENTDYIITLDNDIVFYQPWLKHVEAVIALRYNVYYLDWHFVTFAGQNCFMTIPDELDKLTHVGSFDYKDNHYSLLWAMAQGGGMVLYPYKWLNEHPFSSIGNGVYLGEDEAHCRATFNRYVLYYDSMWLQHDPYREAYPEYAQYYERKESQVERGELTFHAGWDEIDE